MVGMFFSVWRVSNRAISNTILTVKDMTLATVQKAGRNLKRHALAGAASDFTLDERAGLALGAGSEAAGTDAGGVGLGAGGFEVTGPVARGSLAWMELSAFSEVSLFILLCSFWLEAGVAIQAPQCWCDGYISQILNR